MVYIKLYDDLNGEEKSTLLLALNCNAFKSDNDLLKNS